MTNPPQPALPIAAAALLLAALAACTPPLPLDNRSCPCGPGFVCCAAAALCLPPGETCPKTSATVDKATVCQGGQVAVTVTGPNLAGASGFALEGYPVTLRPGATTGQFQVDVEIPHGAALGAKDLSFQTAAGEQQLPALFTVTAITVGPDGNDANHGGQGQPFRSYLRAVQAADKGDTILLLDSTMPYSYLTGETAPAALPDGVTVRGQSWAGTVLLAPLIFAGDGVVKDLRFGSRAHLRGPNSKVLFDNVKGTSTYSGITVDSSATGASVTITGSDTEVQSLDAALAVDASNVQVNIHGGASLANVGGEREAIALTGAGASLHMQSGKLDSPGLHALIDEGGGTTEILRVTVNGILKFAHPESAATISNTQFKTSQQAGHAGILFKGRTLRVSGSQFFVMGIVQDNPASSVVVRDTLFSGYGDAAYTLIAGQLDLGNRDQAGHNRFDSAPNGPGSRIALRIRAVAGGASATSSATMFEGTIPQASAVMGPASRAPWYEILDRVSLTFF